jgi:ATP-dependent DNA helicase RecG
LVKFYISRSQIDNEKYKKIFSLIKYLDQEITYLKGVGPKRGEMLAKELNVNTIRDLLYLFPFKYIDKTKISRINEINQATETVLIKGKIINIEKIKGANSRERLSAILQDESGFVELTWFQRIKTLSEIIKIGQTYIVYGRISSYGSRKSIAHPEMEEFQKDVDLHKMLDPVYSSTTKLDNLGVDSKERRKMLKAIFERIKADDIEETLPEYLLKKFKFPSSFETLVWIHFPRNEEQKNLAQNRIKFEEFLFLQLQLLGSKASRKSVLKGIVFSQVGDSFNTFYKNHLPFELTNAQKRVIKEIRNDLGGGFQMNRLLQGDVGSGKTIVALLSMLLAKDNGYQSCLMAPTEILAAQHYQGIGELLKHMDIKIAFLSGSIKGRARIEILDGLKDGSIDIAIGTHALLEDHVQFANLGISIVDEQHRFGVAQRARMWYKTDQLPPHVLVMTATPIPRTLAMTSYGDLDVSILDELPPGRKPIKTIHRTEYHRPKVIEFMHKEIALGRQIYIVYPLIEESEALDLADLQQGYEALLQYFPMPHFQISVVHGRMKAKDKDYEMERFINRTSQIMVATTVIEVGVNVPNASIMVIENTERFGLSQLHQLRGRVGRGAEQAYCVLMTGHKLSHDAKSRIETMVRTNDGFEIAEADLLLRGPGEIEGTRQSGVTTFRLLNLVKDQTIVNTARMIAEQIIERDPKLQEPVHAGMRAYLKSKAKSGAVDWTMIS